MSTREVDRAAELDFAPAVLDGEHIGDITGAMGTISMHDRAPRRTWKHRLVTLAAIAGPGLIVMIADNDAGGVATYTQAGQNYGYSMLWVLLLLIPVLIISQEMVVRLGAVTGVGHARLIRERFGRFWGWFSVGDLFVLNFLTIVTEFIGIALGMAYFGVRPSLSVPVAALALTAFTVSGSFLALGTSDVLLHRGELPVHPARRDDASPSSDIDPARHLPARRARRSHRRRRAVDRRDRRHHRRALATVLPAVQHRRQAHQPPLDPATNASTPSSVGSSPTSPPVATSSSPPPRSAARNSSDTSPTPAACNPPCTQRPATGPAGSPPSSSSTPRSSAPAR
jgi:hypothetical protein